MTVEKIDRYRTPVPGEEEEVAAHLGLVWRCINKEVHGRIPDEEDLYQIGCIGLLTGVRTYRAGCGTKKPTYYYYCVRNEIMRHLDRKKYLVRRVNMESVPMDWQTALRSVVDEQDVAGQAISAIEAQRIRGYFPRLAKQERVALEIWLEPGATYAEAGRQMGVTLQCARQYILRAREKLRRWIEEDSR